MDDTLPEEWRKVKLVNLLNRISNGANVKQYEEEVGLPITRIETIWNEEIDYDRVKYMQESDEDFVEKYKLLDGDILLSHINSDSHLGKTALFKERGKTLIHGINLLLLRAKSDVNSMYLNYYIRYFKHKGGFYKIAQRAVNQSSVNQKKIKNIDVILPPLPTQHRIVKKIEELFSEPDNGMENLKKAPQQLKTYRQAVLKDAFEGRLTREWRGQQVEQTSAGAPVRAIHELPLRGSGNSSKSAQPTAEELLEQIKAERKAHRQRELAEWEKEVEQCERDEKPGRKPRKVNEVEPISEKSLNELDVISRDISKTSCTSKTSHSSQFNPNNRIPGFPWFSLEAHRP